MQKVRARFPLIKNRSSTGGKILGKKDDDFQDAAAAFQAVVELDQSETGKASSEWQVSTEFSTGVCKIIDAGFQGIQGHEAIDQMFISTAKIRQGSMGSLLFLPSWFLDHLARGVDSASI